MTPQRIICLTEETTEWLYLLGQSHRIVGISGYTVRPARARQEKPRVSAFLSAKIDKILALEPDCVLGFSDLQADIASALIRAHPRLLLPRPRRAHGVARNPHNPMRLPEQVQPLGGFLGQADDALGGHGQENRDDIQVI